MRRRPQRTNAVDKSSSSLKVNVKKGGKIVKNVTKTIVKKAKPTNIKCTKCSKPLVNVNKSKSNVCVACIKQESNLTNKTKNTKLSRDASKKTKALVSKPAERISPTKVKQSRSSQQNAKNTLSNPGTSKSNVVKSSNVKNSTKANKTKQYNFELSSKSVKVNLRGVKRSHTQLAGGESTNAKPLKKQKVAALDESMTKRETRNKKPTIKRSEWVSTINLKRVSNTQKDISPPKAKSPKLKGVPRINTNKANVIKPNLPPKSRQVHKINIVTASPPKRAQKRNIKTNTGLQDSPLTNSNQENSTESKKLRNSRRRIAETKGSKMLHDTQNSNKDNLNNLGENQPSAHLTDKDGTKPLDVLTNKSKAQNSVNSSELNLSKNPDLEHNISDQIEIEAISKSSNGSNGDDLQCCNNITISSQNHITNHLQPSSVVTVDCIVDTVSKPEETFQTGENNTNQHEFVNDKTLNSICEPSTGNKDACEETDLDKQIQTDNDTIHNESVCTKIINSGSPSSEINDDGIQNKLTVIQNSDVENISSNQINSEINKVSNSAYVNSEKLNCTQTPPDERDVSSNTIQIDVPITVIKEINGIHDPISKLEDKSNGKLPNLDTKTYDNTCKEYTEEAKQSNSVTKINEVPQTNNKPNHDVGDNVKDIIEANDVCKPVFEVENQSLSTIHITNEALLKGSKLTNNTFKTHTKLEEVEMNGVTQVYNKTTNDQVHSINELKPQSNCLIEIDEVPSVDSKPTNDKTSTDVKIDNESCEDLQRDINPSVEECEISKRMHQPAGVIKIEGAYLKQANHEHNKVNDDFANTNENCEAPQGTDIEKINDKCETLFDVSEQPSSVMEIDEILHIDFKPTDEVCKTLKEEKGQSTDLIEISKVPETDIKPMKDANEIFSEGTDEYTQIIESGEIQNTTIKTDVDVCEKLNEKEYSQYSDVIEAHEVSQTDIKSTDVVCEKLDQDQSTIAIGNDEFQQTEVKPIDNVCEKLNEEQDQFTEESDTVEFAQTVVKLSDDFSEKLNKEQAKCDSTDAVMAEEFPKTVKPDINVCEKLNEEHDMSTDSIATPEIPQTDLTPTDDICEKLNEDKYHSTDLVETAEIVQTKIKPSGSLCKENTEDLDVSTNVIEIDECPQTEVKTIDSTCEKLDNELDKYAYTNETDGLPQRGDTKSTDDVSEKLNEQQDKFTDTIKTDEFPQTDITPTDVICGKLNEDKYHSTDVIETAAEFVLTKIKPTDGLCKNDTEDPELSTNLIEIDECPQTEVKQTDISCEKLDKEQDEYTHSNEADGFSQGDAKPTDDVSEKLNEQQDKFTDAIKTDEFSEMDIKPDDNVCDKLNEEQGPSTNSIANSEIAQTDITPTDVICGKLNEDKYHSTDVIETAAEFVQTKIKQTDGLCKNDTEDPELSTNLIEIDECPQTEVKQTDISCEKLDKKQDEYTHTNEADGFSQGDSKPTDDVSEKLNEQQDKFTDAIKTDEFPQMDIKPDDNICDKLNEEQGPSTDSIANSEIAQTDITPTEIICEKLNEDKYHSTDVIETTVELVQTKIKPTDGLCKNDTEDPELSTNVIEIDECPQTEVKPTDSTSEKLDKEQDEYTHTNEADGFSQGDAKSTDDVSEKLNEQQDKFTDAIKTDEFPQIDIKPDDNVRDELTEEQDPSTDSTVTNDIPQTDITSIGRICEKINDDKYQSTDAFLETKLKPLDGLCKNNTEDQELSTNAIEIDKFPQTEVKPSDNESEKFNEQHDQSIDAIMTDEFPQTEVKGTDNACEKQDKYTNETGGFSQRDNKPTDDVSEKCNEQLDQSISAFTPDEFPQKDIKPTDDVYEKLSEDHNAQSTDAMETDDTPTTDIKPTDGVCKKLTVDQDQFSDALETDEFQQVEIKPTNDCEEHAKDKYQTPDSIKIDQISQKNIKPTDADEINKIPKADNISNDICDKLEVTDSTIKEINEFLHSDIEPTDADEINKIQKVDNISNDVCEKLELMDSPIKEINEFLHSDIKPTDDMCEQSLNLTEVIDQSACVIKIEEVPQALITRSDNLCHELAQLKDHHVVAQADTKSMNDVCKKVTELEDVPASAIETEEVTETGIPNDDLCERVPEKVKDQPTITMEIDEVSQTDIKLNDQSISKMDIDDASEVALKPANGICESHIEVSFQPNVAIDITQSTQENKIEASTCKIQNSVIDHSSDTIEIPETDLNTADGIDEVSQIGIKTNDTINQPVTEQTKQLTSVIAVSQVDSKASDGKCELNSEIKSQSSNEIFNDHKQDNKFSNIYDSYNEVNDSSTENSRVLQTENKSVDSTSKQSKVVDQTMSLKSNDIQQLERKSAGDIKESTHCITDQIDCSSKGVLLQSYTTISECSSQQNIHMEIKSTVLECETEVVTCADSKTIEYNHSPSPDANDQLSVDVVKAGDVLPSNIEPIKIMENHLNATESKLESNHTTEGSVDIITQISVTSPKKTELFQNEQINLDVDPSLQTSEVEQSDQPMCEETCSDVDNLLPTTDPAASIIIKCADVQGDTMSVENDEGETMQCNSDSPSSHRMSVDDENTNDMCVDTELPGDITKDDCEISMEIN